METITLAGPTPVLYFDPADELYDGDGFNVLLADAAFVDRFATLDEAVVAFRALLQEEP